MEPALVPAFEKSPGGQSFILLRPVAASDGYGRGAMMGNMMGGMGQGAFRGARRYGLPPPGASPPGSLPGGVPELPPAAGPAIGEGQGLPSASPPPARPLPRYLFLEYDAMAATRDSYRLLVVAAILSAALLGVYALLLALYRRNAELRERELRNREVLQLGEAARTLAHEIKNPLAIIRIQTASLRRVAPESGPAAAIIEEEIDRLTLLSDRIREFLRGGAGEPESVELGSFLASFAARYGEGGIELASLPEGAVARVDPRRLAEALDNLVRNAVE
ncbi:MAG: HAMP domain-containing histidine kinase, partial [Spirochaetaceae bacterium]|nr:HAMP domain-containing histidine kinase [Spirochaetaceae bacterium]